MRHTGQREDTWPARSRLLPLSNLSLARANTYSRHHQPLQAGQSRKRFRVVARDAGARANRARLHKGRCVLGVCAPRDGSTLRSLLRLASAWNRAASKHQNLPVFPLGDLSSFFFSFAALRVNLEG